MIKDVYQALKKRLSEIDKLDRVDWFLNQYNEVDVDNGNVLVYETPVVYVEFAPVEWKTLTQNAQRAEILFSVHLVTETVADDDKRLLETQYVNHAAIENEVFKKLMNWRTHYSFVDEYAGLQNGDDWMLIESIVRTASEPDHALTEFFVTVQQFKCVIYDYSAVKQWQQVQAQLQINAEISENTNF